MLHVHEINLQANIGGGEVYTRSLTRALASAGARVSLYVNPGNRIWDGLVGERIECIPVPQEAALRALLPARSLVLTQGPLSRATLQWLDEHHLLTGFAHMPMFQRSAAEFNAFRLVFSVSRYCIGLLQRAGISHAYPEPVYGTIDVARSGEPVVLRSPLIVDRKKPRDVLFGGYRAIFGMPGANEPFQRRPGLTLGLVSLISPIKQFLALFGILAPVLAQRPRVNLEIFGSGGYDLVRDLGYALAPLGARARFWGYQPNVGALYPQLDYLMTGLPEKEALGLNALEAQGCGTPVLAPDAPPFTETVVQGSGFRYRDPRQDGGRHFAEILDAILAGRPRPDPRIAARDHLAQFTHVALVERARRMINALSDLE